jgi:hypothetical protein
MSAEFSRFISKWLVLFHFPYFETAYCPVPLLFSNYFIILLQGQSHKDITPSQGTDQDDGIPRTQWPGQHNQKHKGTDSYRSRATETNPWRVGKSPVLQKIIEMISWPLLNSVFLCSWGFLCTLDIDWWIEYLDQQRSSENWPSCSKSKESPYSQIAWY